MLRTTTLSAAALLGLALLVPTGAGAVGETCQGRAATVVGTLGGTVDGTEGADVIVSNGADRLNALGGDDVICVTGPAPASPDDVRTLTLSAGAGNDAVEAVTPGWGTFGTLGLGADTYTGTSDAPHSITAGENLPLGSDTEADDIRVSAGTAAIYSGADGQPNADVVIVSGGFVQATGVMTGSAVLQGGARSTLRMYTPTGDATIDASRGTARTRTSQLEFSGFTDLAFGSGNFDGTLTYFGTDGDDRLSVEAPGAYERHVRMGGGDDTFTSSSIGGPGSRLVAGAGRDHLVLSIGSVDALSADLDDDVVLARDGTRKIRRTYQRFEDVTLAARTVSVDGSPSGERITVDACRAEVRADAGRDVVVLRADLLHPFEGPVCSSRRGVVDAGRGTDRLVGSTGPDVLAGGPGRDRADGREGRDSCSAETVTRCEVRR